MYQMGFPDGPALKNLPAVQETWETWIPSLGGEDPPGSGRIPWCQFTPVFLPGESHGQKSLASYRPRNFKRAGHS